MNKSDERPFKPLFIPHSNQHGNSKTLDSFKKFHEKELTLPNGLVTESKVFEPVKAVTIAEIHAEPFTEPSCSKGKAAKEEKDDNVKKKMTIYSIFKKNSKIGTSLSKSPQDYAKCDISVTIEGPDDHINQSSSNLESQIEEKDTFKDKETKSNLAKTNKLMKKITSNAIRDKINEVNQRPLLPPSPIKISTIPRLAYAPNYPHYERMSDLRKILNPEVEKRDFETILRSFWDSILDCHCFECTFNNAAKVVTFLVLLITFILVIKAMINIARYV